VGGETRLVGLSRTASYSQFLQQLAKATSAVWDEVSRQLFALFTGRYRYVLPFLASAFAGSLSVGTGLCAQCGGSHVLYLKNLRCWCFVSGQTLCGWRDAACGAE
jgi:hypothetical protein